MDFLKGLAEQKLQEYTNQGRDDDDNDNEGQKSSSQQQTQQQTQQQSNAIEHPNVEPPKESDIHEAKDAHEQVYKNDASDVSDDTVGKAAGTEAFHEYEKSGGEGGKSQLMQMAMGQAMALFSGGKGQDKSTVIQSALATATKLYMGKAGEGGGGVAQLMSMFGGGGGGEGGAASKVMGMLGDNPQVAELLGKYMK